METVSFPESPDVSQVEQTNKDGTTSLFTIVNPAEGIGLNLIKNVSKYMIK